MTTVTVQERFEQPIEEVWPLVSDFGGIGKYLKGVECTLEGTGIGSERSIGMPGGAVVERLIWLDPDNYDLGYTILEAGGLPFSRYVASIRLKPDGGGTLATWQGIFEPAGVSEEEASKIAHGIYSGGLKGYKKALEG